MGHMATLREGAEPPWIAKHAASHVKKLFHALWGPSFGREKLTGEQLQKYQELAQMIHETRLRGLYVSTSSEAGLPHEAVEVAESEKLVSLTEADLELARAHKLDPFTPAEESDLLWFFEAADDPEKFRMIFGTKSLDKLKELRDGRTWMHWVRQQFEEAEALGRKQAEEELQKPLVRGTGSLDPRWRVGVRFVTASHSIRPKDLQTWNRRVNWAKLAYVNKKDALGVDILLPKAVPLSQVYDAALEIANRVLIALNIGTRGFFWWSLPEHVDRYYESIDDLETKTQVVAERRPAVKIDWRSGPLDENTLNDVALCLAMLPTGPDKAQRLPYQPYLNGLAILARSDIHFHAEGSAYSQFFTALREAFRLSGAWEQGTTLVEACRKEFTGLFDQEADWERLVTLGESIENGPPFPTSISLEDVAVIKILCEAFFLKTFRAEAKRRLKEKSDEAST